MLPEDEPKDPARGADPMRALVAEAKVKGPVTKLLVDAGRKKLIALARAENSILLYELPGLAQAGKLFVGSDPVDFDYDPASGRAVVALGTPPQVAVFDLDGMERVSVAGTKSRVRAIRWLRKSIAVAVREDVVPKSAVGPETDVLRVSLLKTSNGRFLGDFRNGVLRGEARDARRRIDAL